LQLGSMHTPIHLSRIGRCFYPSILTRSQLDRLFGACGRGPLGQRTRCGLGFLYWNGCRVGSLVKLTEDCIDLEAGEIRYYGAKGGGFYTSGLNDALRDVLLPWLATRRRLGIGADRPIWCDLRGNQQTTDSVRSQLRRLKAKSGIRVRVNAHSARHRFCRDCVNAGMNIAAVSQALGNVSIQFTYFQASRLTAPAAVRGLRFR
jgi:integrase